MICIYVMRIEGDRHWFLCNVEREKGKSSERRGREKEMSAKMYLSITFHTANQLLGFYLQKSKYIKQSQISSIETALL